MALYGQPRDSAQALERTQRVRRPAGLLTRGGSSLRSFPHQEELLTQGGKFPPGPPLLKSSS